MRELLEKDFQALKSDLSAMEKQDLISIKHDLNLMEKVRRTAPPYVDLSKYSALPSDGRSCQEFLQKLEERHDEVQQLHLDIEVQQNALACIVPSRAAGNYHSMFLWCLLHTKRLEKRFIQYGMGFFLTLGADFFPCFSVPFLSTPLMLSLACAKRNICDGCHESPAVEKKLYDISDADSRSASWAFSLYSYNNAHRPRRSKLHQKERPGVQSRYLFHMPIFFMQRHYNKAFPTCTGISVRCAPCTPQCAPRLP
jgi:hypothetical protein